MIQVGTRLRVADNTGAKEVECIRILGSGRRHRADLGQKIVISIKSAIPHAAVKAGEVSKAVIVRQKKEYSRPDGSYIRFDENAVVLLLDTDEPKGTRVFGPVAREVRQAGYKKIISLAPEVL